MTLLIRIFSKIYHWLKKKFGKKEFEPRVETMTIEPSNPVRKNTPKTIVSKSGTRYRIIRHAANKKANSKAYTQKIIIC